MILALALLVGVLFTVSLYLMMRRNLVKVLIGLIILSNAINLLIFTLGRLVRGRPPLIPMGATALQPPYADPLPQALILTAIVISFGVTAFAITLMRQVYQTLGTSDLNQLRDTDIQPRYHPDHYHEDDEVEEH
ncbi:MAG: Na+/H+ antiporter subunit C [Thermanaerothrix sp.]|jgi:multicomponent Na+:H+ antiporter subunit C|uniref:Na+/H+ antiporter subunit C n=1 Tax=Thermanaerothrix solaris TaxID=3058434 RepID=A0ABU3NLQ6_9CHLR|nr:Na+/H+ antiporter subunit C [Thermanaerothrix sp. 4228-RoL]MDT8897781.1 Na+/H+ antiporter subunit C [Thermanaerothrix sp. 4228-RoL]